MRFVSLKLDPIGNTPEQFAIACKRIYTAANTEKKMIGLVKQGRGQGLTLRAISEALAKRGAFNRAGRQFNSNSIHRCWQLRGI